MISASQSRVRMKGFVVTPPGDGHAAATKDYTGRTVIVRMIYMYDIFCMFIIKLIQLQKLLY